MISQISLQKIKNSIFRGNCCLVVGPRYRRKSKLVNVVASELERTGFYKAAYVSMESIAYSNSQHFYQILYRTISLQVFGTVNTRRRKIGSSTEFSHAMLDLISVFDNNLLLIIDDLELAPPNIISQLLGAIRSIYVTLFNTSGHRLQAIVSGTVNLRQLALRGVSRFESISDLVLVDELTPEEAHELVLDLFSKHKIGITTALLQDFLSQTGGDAVLIKLLTSMCIKEIGKNRKELDKATFEKSVLQAVLRKPNFEVFDTLRLMEGNPELLSCYLQIAQKGSVHISELPLRIADHPNALDLCGVFHEINQMYSIKAPLWNSILSRHFTFIRCGQIFAVAGEWQTAIHYYEKVIGAGEGNKRSELFNVIIQGMQSSEDSLQALDILFQGLHACYPDCEIEIYWRTGATLQLKHYFSKGHTDARKPPEEFLLEMESVPEVEALHGPDYSLIFNENRTRFLIPLRTHGGSNAIGLISYCGDFSSTNKHSQHENLLQLVSFLHLAARAIDGRRKYSTALKDARTHAEVLRNLDYILTRVLHNLDLSRETILRLLLAGLTADIGLRFNRAVFFVINENNQEVMGEMGVGHLTREEADADWKNYPHLSLDNLLSDLMSPDYHYTRLHEAIQGIKFPLQNNDFFGKAYFLDEIVQSKELTLKDVKNLPDLFLDVLDPPNEFIIAPLTAGKRRLGVIYVDNKYTHDPIDNFQIASLNSFLTQVSLVMEISATLRKERETREYLDLLVSSSQDGIIAVSNKGLVERYSEGARKILGYSVDEVLNGKKWVGELYDSKETAQKINEILLNSGQIRDYETNVMDKDNNPIPIVLSASLLRDRNGGPMGSVGFFKDLRPLRKVENSLRLVLDTVHLLSMERNSKTGLVSLAKKIIDDHPVTFCSIFLFDESKRNLILNVAQPVPRPFSSDLEWTPSFGQSIFLNQTDMMSHFLNLPKPCIYYEDQYIDDVEVVRYIQKIVLLKEKIRAALIVPMKSGSETFGVCIFGETRSGNRSPFDDEKVEIISSMVTQGSIFLDRLQSHEATQKKLMLVEKIRSIGDDLVTAPPVSMKNILGKVVKSASEFMESGSAVIYPWNQKKIKYDTENIVHFGLQTKKIFSEKSHDKDNNMVSIVQREGVVIVDDVKSNHDRSGNVAVWVNSDGFLDSEGVQAFIGVSLRGGENPLGVLFVNFLEPHYFNPSEIEAVLLFANQAAIAIENSRLYEDLQLKLEESLILQKVGMSLTEKMDQNSVLDRVLQAALELISADESNILFYEKEKDEFRENALMSSGIGQPIQSYLTQTRQHNGYTYEIISNRTPVNIQDTRLHPRINPVTLQKGRLAAFGVPLIGREGPVGVLWTHWKVPHMTSERDERLLMSLAGQAAISIENANLLERLKTENILRNKESVALQQIGISLTESIELDETLYRVLQAALSLINGDEDSIIFYNESRKEFDRIGLTCLGLKMPLLRYETKVRSGAGLAYEIIKNKTPIIISDSEQDERISKIAIEKGRRAMVGVPLLDHDGPVGVLWVNWRTPRKITENETNLLTALASQATVAIKGARRYDELTRRSKHLHAVHEAGKVISAASVGLDKQQVLDRILEQAIVHITGVDGQEASVGTIHLLEKETGDLLLESVYPKDYPKNLLNKFKRISLNDRNLSSKIGISGKAVSMRQALLVPDVSKDKDYIWHNENTKSELAIPMFDKDGNILGVMDVESRHINGFDNLDKDSLSLLVEMAVIAIQNSDQTMQLSRSNAVALMGAWGAEIAHILNREVGNIRRGVALLRQQFGVTDKIVEELNVIDRSASQLALPEIPEQIPGYDFASSHASCDLNTTIQWAIDVFRAGHPGVQIFFETGDVDIKVAMHERFVYLMAINLLRNSEHAVALSDEKNIYLRTRIDDLSTLFEIENTGATLRPEIIPQLFKQLIPHQDGRKGRGLLLVGFIVEQHGGRIEVVQKNKNVGACFRFWLPLAQKQNEI